MSKYLAIMNTEEQTLFKDIIYNLQAYIYWDEEYKAEGYWDAQQKANKFFFRLKELLPEALNYFK